MHRPFFRSGIFPITLGVSCLYFHAAAAIDFVHEVVPILKARCTECHGGKEAKGGFSMNTRELFLEGDAALPGDAAKSYFLDLVHSTDLDDQMPPSKKDRVPAGEIAVLERWVNAGLPWEPGYTFGNPPMSLRCVPVGRRCRLSPTGVIIRWIG